MSCSSAKKNATSSKEKEFKAKSEPCQKQCNVTPPNPPCCEHEVPSVSNVALEELSDVSEKHEKSIMGCINKLT